MGEAQAADAADCARDLREAVEPVGGQPGTAEHQQQAAAANHWVTSCGSACADARAEALVDLLRGRSAVGASNVPAPVVSAMAASVSVSGGTSTT